ncbi:MAG TPA: response regulator [Polyangiales bacterium]|nr:response regulator [Polyangiales bacterium]
MKRVLIVDDGRENLYLLRMLLEAHGYVVDEAHHGGEALERARVTPPQLVVSDLLMPVMDGYTLLRHWKADPHLSSIPFVVYTATYTGSKDARLAQDLGADAFITKDAEAEDFMERIVEVLRKAQQGELSPASAPHVAEADIQQSYSQTLIRKLEQKALQLELANRSLQEDIVRRRQAESHLEQALTMARMGVWRWDLRNDELVSIQGCGPLTGLSARDAPRTGREFFQRFVHADDSALVEDKVEHAKRGADYYAEFRIVLADGERWVATRGRCVHDAAGHPVALTGLDQDITERKVLEERLRQSQRMEAIGQLAGGIAHDFNNILAAIIGNAELARLDLKPEHPAFTSLVEILRAGQRAKELTQRILTFSRPSTYRLKPIQLQPVLQEAERLLRATLPAGIDLAFITPAEVPAVRADASQIHQVVLNLVTNAWHAMENRPGRIETQLEACRVDSSESRTHPDLPAGAYVRLTVRDTGVGMDESTLEHVFEPFFTTKAPGHGAGLGLSVVHGIVRGHGGAIFASSQLGRGTTFEVYFPACEEGTKVSSTELTPPRDVCGRGEHILYIDDEESLVYLAVRFLERGGYRVDGFTRGQEALKAFRAEPRSYDVVITDNNMPGMSGMELAQQLMRIRPDAPVALTSGYLRPSEIQAAHALGIREVIPKPYLVEELGPLVQRMLSPEPQHT